MEEPILLSTIDDQVAAEKGRLLAAKAIAENPDQRKRVEDVLGVSYCKLRWPEAYRPTGEFQFPIDRLTFIAE